MQTIDLNCDLGEYQSAEQAALEAAIMPYISSCNVACGGHTGNSETMEATVKQALKNKLSIGAHPSYPDPQNFGRKSMQISMDDLLVSTIAQIDALEEVTKRLSAKVSYIKPHGALYNDLAQDVRLAKAFVKRIKATFPHLVLLGLPNSEVSKVCEKLEYTFAAEGFADRAYTNEGFLVSRTLAGAVFHEETKAANQALCLAQKKPFLDFSGSQLKLDVQSICVHGDSQNALKMVQSIRKIFDLNNIQLQSFC